MRSRAGRTLTTLAAAAALALLAPASGAAAKPRYAPLDQPGPALSVPGPDLAKALRCTDGVRDAGRDPVLLLAGTTVTPREDFSWNYERALSDRDVPWCALFIPGANMGDIQTSAEYVVSGIRRMHELSGRRVAIIGHSQGGMVGRWALRFWPDTRAMVSDLIGLAPSNQGTDAAIPLCMLPGGCAPAVWQQRSDSPFIAALNSGAQTFAGIDYTVVYSHTDEVVFPNLTPSGNSTLHGGEGRVRNVALQDICPLAGDEHLGVGTYDPTAWALAWDALQHDGPADPSRVHGTCDKPFMPGVDPATFLADYGDAGAFLAKTLLTYPHVPAEPPLRCYVTASCPASRRAKAKARAGRRAHRRARTTTGRERLPASSTARTAT
jgi:pimeloyl-ACP methyl ester carboxylesterase